MPVGFPIASTAHTGEQKRSAAKQVLERREMVRNHSTLGLDASGFAATHGPVGFETGQGWRRGSYSALLLRPSCRANVSRATDLRQLGQCSIVLCGSRYSNSDRRHTRSERLHKLRHRRGEGLPSPRCGVVPRPAGTTPSSRRLVPVSWISGGFWGRTGGAGRSQGQLAAFARRNPQWSPEARAKKKKNG